MRRNNKQSSGSLPDASDQTERRKMSKDERYSALLNNGLDWYLVDYNDGETKLMHQTSLSGILECGRDQSEFGIEKMQQCWNGDEIGVWGEV